MAGLGFRNIWRRHSRLPNEECQSGTAMPTPAWGRIGFLDSIRGVAALAVCFQHLALVLYPASVFGPSSPKSPAFEYWIWRLPIVNVLLQGQFAVAIFFVLSGIALSTRPLTRRTQRRDAISGAVRRLPRLMIPTLIANLLTLIILFIYSGPAKNYVTTNAGVSWFGIWARDRANVVSFLYQSFWGTWVHGLAGFDPVLWTMQTELLGSFLVFGLLFVLRERWMRFIAYPLLVLLLKGINPYLVCFPVGMALGELWIAYRDILVTRRRVMIVLPLLIYGLLLGSFPEYGAPFYTHYLLVDSGNRDGGASAHIVGAILVVGSVLALPAIQRHMNRPSLRFLGRISFGLYLTHVLVIMTFGVAVLDIMRSTLGTALALALSALSSLVVCIGAAWAFTVVVDEPSIRFAARCFNFLASCAVRARRNAIVRKNRSGRTQHVSA